MVLSGRVSTVQKITTRCRASYSNETRDGATMYTGPRVGVLLSLPFLGPILRTEAINTI